MKVKSGFLLILLLFSVIANAAVDYHAQSWTSFSVLRPISNNENFSYYLKPEIRFIDNSNKFNEVSLYLGLKYQLIKHSSLWFGVYRSFSKDSDGNAEVQNRLWEQLVFNRNFREISFTSRTRLEQRQEQGYAGINHRLRQMFRLLYNLPTKSERWLHLGEELFFSLNQPDWVVQRTFSQNRAFIGIEVPFNDTQSFEIGYLNQFVYSSENNNISHVIYLNFSV